MGPVEIMATTPPAAGVTGSSAFHQVQECTAPHDGRIFLAAAEQPLELRGRGLCRAPCSPGSPPSSRESVDGSGGEDATSTATAESSSSHPRLSYATASSGSSTSGDAVCYTPRPHRHHILRHLHRAGTPALFCDAFSVRIHRRTDAAVRAALAHPHMPCFAATEVVCGRSVTFERIPLSEGGLALRDTPNAGGASVRSETLSFEVLRRAFGAELKATETQVWYYPRDSNMTDYVCSIGGATIGVSVTRAFRYKKPCDACAPRFTAAEAARLLGKKLSGANAATKAVLYPEFSRQILHVWCPSMDVAEELLRAYRRLKAETRANTVVLVSVAPSEWLYTERLDDGAHKKKPKGPVPPAKPRADPPRDPARTEHYRHKRFLRRERRRRARRAALLRVALPVLAALLALAVLSFGYYSWRYKPHKHPACCNATTLPVTVPRAAVLADLVLRA
eukprot:TRINITY_DN24603_c0_g1_i1.p1 TRINITY_DN24603_c0_g1~~TRINITY_DN24603_c0_g1_i1.p1  ORF type:complete len:450 (+),score=97.75 TRINITY_DN24603_c0_g1_i1:300-1649(+)